MKFLKLELHSTNVSTLEEKTIPHWLRWSSIVLMKEIKGVGTGMIVEGHGDGGYVAQNTIQEIEKEWLDLTCKGQAPAGYFPGIFECKTPGSEELVFVCINMERLIEVHSWTSGDQQGYEFHLQDGKGSGKFVAIMDEEELLSALNLYSESIGLED